MRPDRVSLGCSGSPWRPSPGSYYLLGCTLGWGLQGGPQVSGESVACGKDRLREKLTGVAMLGSGHCRSEVSGSQTEPLILFTCSHRGVLHFKLLNGEISHQNTDFWLLL